MKKRDCPPGLQLQVILTRMDVLTTDPRGTKPIPEQGQRLTWVRGGAPRLRLRWAWSP